MRARGAPTATTTPTPYPYGRDAPVECIILQIPLRKCKGSACQKPQVCVSLRTAARALMLMAQPAVRKMQDIEKHQVEKASFPVVGWGNKHPARTYVAPMVLIQTWGAQSSSTNAEFEEWQPLRISKSWLAEYHMFRRVGRAIPAECH